MRSGVRVATGLFCLLVTAGAAGCGGGGAAESRSGKELLDDANAAMRGLSSVTIEVTSTPAKGDTVTSRLVTDLDDRCSSRTTWSEGGTLEQIRIGATDYVRPDSAYLQRWEKSDTGAATAQRLWVKTPVDADSADSAGGGIASCTRPFTSFGTVEKGAVERIDGKPARKLTVTDDAYPDATYTFHVAAEGEPYLLRSVYEGDDFHTVTTFSGFGDSLGVNPPKSSEVVETDSSGR
ncbi:hypothetical protein [Streptomyces sp. CRN 30]|uniref:hypothetical protein n=1 Tax=Streptomyces sp. CRN 30 TaxID=3075613 RepID=UPI002A83800A|nr:hypothetical protein [Streptomyces sp. CRN 30]